MPIGTRPVDALTRDALLLGFSLIEFELANGSSFDPPVPLGVLESQELQKTVETARLEDGSAGFLTIDREVVSRFEANFLIETFRFRHDIARYIFGSTTPVEVSADAAAAVTDDQFNLPLNDPFERFARLSSGNVDIDESTLAITCAELTSEAVGTGDGSSGGTQGDFALKYKIKDITDVTEFLVGGVDEIAKLVAGSTPTANQIAITVGEDDSLVTGSGAITFGSSETPALGAAITATYQPSFSGTDFANAALPASADHDYIFDPHGGRIRMLREAADDTPLRLAADAAQQPLLAAYNYNRKAHHQLFPFRNNQVDGRATIYHWTDLGVNFTWPIPSVTLLMTDDPLTFGADGFVSGAIRMNINDAGGTDRFGTMELSTETEANA